MQSRTKRPPAVSTGFRDVARVTSTLDLDAITDEAPSRSQYRVSRCRLSHESSRSICNHGRSALPQSVPGFEMSP
eukprot:790870-Prorocentrum_minimum.AAC.1